MVTYSSTAFSKMRAFFVSQIWSYGMGLMSSGIISCLKKLVSQPSLPSVAHAIILQCKIAQLRKQQQWDKQTVHSKYGNRKMPIGDQKLPRLKTVHCTVQADNNAIPQGVSVGPMNMLARKSQIPGSLKVNLKVG